MAAKDAWGDRKDEGKTYQAVAAAIEKALAQPSGSTLRLTATLTPSHTVDAHATLSVTDSAVLRAVLESKPAPQVTDPAAAAAPPTQPAAQAPPPKLVMNFALVQREVRFSGENGIRFHSMIVRDLARATADGFPVAMEGSTTDSVTFDPAVISASLHHYLADFSKHNDRFASVHFLSTDTEMPLDDLAVAAWVEDLTSHRVIEAAYAPLTPTSTQKAGE